MSKMNLEEDLLLFKKGNRIIAYTFMHTHDEVFLMKIFEEALPWSFGWVRDDRFDQLSSQSKPDLIKIEF